MTITATFTANFASFNDAVLKADAKLKDFGEGADKVGKKLERMANEFSGRKIVQEATIMAQAIEEIGGASRLTAQELQRAGAKAEEAIAKMKALGMDVPAGIQKIATQAQDAAAKLKAVGEQGSGIKKVATETQNVTAKQTELIGTLRNVAGAFGIAFSVQAVVGFFKGVVETAGAVADMADKLGISAEAAQRFTFAAKQTGASMETVDKALLTMNKNLAGGGNSTYAALSAIGLQFETIRDLKPEDAFLAIADGIRQLPDPMRQAQIAMELLGQSGAQLLPAIKEGFVELGNAAPVASERAIRAIDEWSDAFDGWVANLKAKSIEAVAAILDPAAAHEEAVQRMARASGELPPIIPEKELNRIKQVPPALRIVTVSVDEERDAIKRMDAALKEQNASAEKAAKAQQAWNEQLRAFRNFIGLRQMEDARAAMDATATQIEANVELEFELGKMYNANAAALGAYAGNVGLYTQQWAGYMALAPGITQNITNNGKALEDLSSWTDGLDQLERVLSGVQTRFAQTAVVAARAMKEIDTTWKNTGLSKSQKIGSSIAVGTAAAASMFEGTGTKTASTLSGAASGAAMGMMVGSVVPVIGTAIGAGVGAIAGAIGGFVKGKKIEKELNAQKQALIDSAGGWHALNSAAAKAGLTLDKVLNAKSAQEFQTAVTELQTEFAELDEAVARYGLSLKDLADPVAQQEAFEDNLNDLIDTFHDLEQAGYDSDAILGAMGEDFVGALRGAAEAGLLEGFIEDLVESGRLTAELGEQLMGLVASAGPDYAALTAMADEYGITLQQLGPQFQQAHISETANQIFTDFQALIDAGADVNGVMLGMQDEVQKLLDDSVKFGTAIPNNMRPMLETMAANGLLLDENGEKMEDLSGLTFADSPLEQGIDALTLAIEGLVAALGGVPGAIDAIPRSVDVDVNYRQNSIGAGPQGSDVPGFASGTGGRYLNFGSGTLAMLHGREKITPAGASEGGDVSELRAEVQGLRADLARQNRLLPKQLRDALLLAS